MFMSDLGNVASTSEHIFKGPFVRRATQVSSVALLRGNARVYRGSGVVLAREQGIRMTLGWISTSRFCPIDRYRD